MLDMGFEKIQFWHSNDIEKVGNMKEGARSSSAKTAMARRASPARGRATSRRTDLSDWTMRGPSGAEGWASAGMAASIAPPLPRSAGTGGGVARNRRKRHSIRHVWLPTVSHSHLLQRPFPSPHPFTGSSSSGEFLDGLSAGKPRGNCRRIKESLPFRTRKALASHSCECARTGIGRRAEAVLGASGYPTAVS